MVCTNVFAAGTDAEAQQLFTSVQQQFLALRRGRPGQLPPPVDDIRTVASEMELLGLEQTFRYAAVGAPDTVRRKLGDFLRVTGANELMATARSEKQTSELQSLMSISYTVFCLNKKKLNKCTNMIKTSSEVR